MFDEKLLMRISNPKFASQFAPIDQPVYIYNLYARGFITKNGVFIQYNQIQMGKEGNPGFNYLLELIHMGLMEKFRTEIVRFSTTINNIGVIIKDQIIKPPEKIDSPEDFISLIQLSNENHNTPLEEIIDLTIAILNYIKNFSNMNVVIKNVNIIETFIWILWNRVASYTLNNPQLPIGSLKVWNKVHNFDAESKNECSLQQYHDDSRGKDCQFVGFLDDTYSLHNFLNFMKHNRENLYKQTIIMIPVDPSRITSIDKGNYDVIIPKNSANVIKKINCIQCEKKDRDERREFGKVVVYEEKKNVEEDKINGEHVLVSNINHNVTIFEFQFDDKNIREWIIDYNIVRDLRITKEEGPPEMNDHIEYNIQTIINSMMKHILSNDRVNISFGLLNDFMVIKIPVGQIKDLVTNSILANSRQSAVVDYIRHEIHMLNNRMVGGRKKHRKMK